MNNLKMAAKTSCFDQYQVTLVGLARTVHNHAKQIQFQNKNELDKQQTVKRKM